MFRQRGIGFIVGFVTALAVILVNTYGLGGAWGELGRIFHRTETSVATVTSAVAAKKSDTRLLIGEQAAADGPVDIPFSMPIDLDGKSKQEVLNIRKQAVQRYLDKLVKNYSPDERVYGQIEDGMPWWGTVGQSYFWRMTDNFAAHAADGPSEESIDMLNPFHLVSLNQSFTWDRRIDGIETLVKTTLLDDLFPRPKSLTWFPKEKKAVAIYPVSEWVERLKPYVIWKSENWRGFYNLNIVNARDLGFEYVRVNTPNRAEIFQLQNRELVTAPQPYPIRDFLHRGSSCGIASGCNNASPSQDNLHSLWVDRLPASLFVDFWMAEPKENQPADFTYEIRFE